MKWLCLDYGQVRTGVAVSDAGGRMAFPRRTLISPANSSRERFFDALLRCIADEAPDGIVLGLPLLADGGESLTTRQVRNFAKRLKRRTPLPLYLMPELLSSQEAEADLREAGLARRRRAAVLDQQAAVRILESFLNQAEEHRRRA